MESNNKDIPDGRSEWEKGLGFTYSIVMKNVEDRLSKKLKEVGTDGKSYLPKELTEAMEEKKTWVQEQEEDYIKELIKHNKFFREDLEAGCKDEVFINFYNTKKYYTPELHEFGMGFECYYSKLSDSDFNYTICDSSIIRHAENLISRERVHFEYVNTFKVKYLDKEDIESLGWEYVPSTTNSSMSQRWWSEFKKNGYVIKECSAWADGNIHITKPNPPNMKGMDEVLFRGDIKNKSELKRLIKQLRINGE